MMLLKILVTLLLGVPQILSLKGPFELSKWISFEYRPMENFPDDNFLKSDKYEESKIMELEQPEKNLLSVAERPDKKSLHKPKRQISSEKDPELILLKGINLLQDSVNPEIIQELDKKHLKTPTPDKSSDLPKLEETNGKGAETKLKLKDNRGQSLLEDTKLSMSSLGNHRQHLESSLGKDQDKNSIEQNKRHLEISLENYQDPKDSLGDVQKHSLVKDQKFSLEKDQKHSPRVNKISPEDSLTDDQNLLESEIGNEQENISIITEDKGAVKNQKPDIDNIWLTFQTFQSQNFL